ncbi:hypothetical protein ACTMQQ_28420 [Pseudomonas syringae pv. aptata]|uniref:hypothetical protein n=1 Tax=Pseudomonas syringae TaxID=317 RepID=UPI001E2867F0|nr:hypothetical protein [Pseudomonas syringae]QOQ33608.1 hypothetical protein [Pseudomonas syringae pv. actinidiae]
MKFITAAVMAFIVLPVFADSKSDDMARVKMIQDGIKICDAKGFSTVGEKDTCVSGYTAKANGLYPPRGSEEYSKKHYAGLGKSAAEGALQRLQREWVTAQKGGYFSARRKPGVVTKKAIVQEGWWIQVHVLGARQTQDDPWFIECKGGKTLNIVRRCPLGKGGEE